VEGTVQLRVRIVWRAIVILALALVLVGGILWAAKDPIFKSLAVQRFREATGLEARMSQLKVGVASASVTVKDLEVQNPPRFGRGPLVTLPELYAVLDRAEAAAGTLHFKELRCNLGELNVIKDTNGHVNLGALSWTGRLAFGGIDKLNLSLGKVNFTDLRQPGNTATLDLGIRGEVVTNLHTSADVTNWVSALLWRIALQEAMRTPTQPNGGLLRRWLEKGGQGSAP
jgi:hypothetical protein